MQSVAEKEAKACSVAELNTSHAENGKPNWPQVFHDYKLDSTEGMNEQECFHILHEQFFLAA